MKCLFLAAGYATRLYPLTENFPKPLLEVGDSTILDRLIEDLAPLVEEFVVISNHKFASIFRDWAEGKPVVVLDDGTESNETRLGAVRDIQFAVEKLGITDDCLIMAGDNVLDFSLQGFVDFAREKGTSCVMCHPEFDPAKQRRTAIITVDGNGLITSYEEKPQRPKGDLAVPPFYFYRGADLARVTEALADGCNADAPGSFAAWLSGKAPVHAYVMPGHRYDIGDVESYQAVRMVFGGT